ncbi:hypothetical protein BG015_006556, partial [Linnemannia schmuckeri]
CPDDLRQLLQTDQVSNPNNTFFDMCSKAEGFDTIYVSRPRHQGGVVSRSRPKAAAERSSHLPACPPARLPVRDSRHYAFGPKGATKGMFAKAMNSMRSHTPTTSSNPAPPAFDPMAMEIDNISLDPTTRALMASVQSLTIA